jgi:aminopeptidase N
LQMLLPKGGGAGAGGASPVDDLMDSMLEFVTAHEVAHQYWHGLVGSDSRLHPYLDEGLAQWTAITYLEDRYGAAKAKQVGDMNVAMNYKVMRLLGNDDAPVDRPASAFANMVSYAGLVYGKGPYLWSALRTELGDKAYFDAMRSYVAKNRLRLAPPRALIDELAAVDPAKSAKVRALAKRWLDEAHGDDDVGKGNLLEMLGPALGIDPSTIDPELLNLAQQLLESPEVGDLLDGLLDD